MGKLLYKAVMWDVYGTLLELRVGDLDDMLSQESQLLSAARNTIIKFKLGLCMKEIARPGENFERSLIRLYLDEIRRIHAVKKKEGVEYPEVQIEKIWRKIINLAIRNGYKLRNHQLMDELVFDVAYFFDSEVNKPKRLIKNAAKILEQLRNQGLIQGLISNAQFYTEMNLYQLLLAENLEFKELFNHKLLIYSYKLGFSKPNIKIFQEAAISLQMLGIESNQVVYIGDNLSKDIKPAKKIGFTTVLLAKDPIKYNELNLIKFKPDHVIDDLSGLGSIVERLK